MSKGFGIHGSTTDHGGVVISTQSRSSQMGNLFLRAGDGFACPKCKTWSTLIKGGVLKSMLTLNEAIIDVKEG